MSKPYSIKIFLPGGDPDGLRTIEKSNWIGAGIVIPRAMRGEAKSRGRSANGRLDWKTKDGKTLKDIQEVDATA